MGDPLDDLAAQQKADRLRASVTQAQGVAPSPDQWAQHQQAASALGVSPTLVATDPAFYHQAAATQSFDFSTYAKTYPLLSAWASTPDNAAVAHDDLNHLSGIEQVGHFAKSLLWDAPRALASEAYSKLIHGTAETAGKGMVNLGASLEPGGLVNRTLGTLGRSGQGIPALVALLAGKQLGAGSQTLQEMGTDVATSNRATQQAITGSYAPSWGGKAGGFAGDIAGTLGRYAIANAVLPGSSAAAMGLESGSNAYYDTGQQTDPATGQPYTDNQKRAMALIHGGVGFGLGFTHLVPGMGPSTGSALGVAAKELLVKAPITAAALTGSDLLSRAGVLGQDISADQVGQTFLQNYIQMAGFHGAGLIGQLSAIAQGSKLRKRSAEKFQEATKAALADSGIDTLNIPADRLDTYFQSKKMDSTTEVARILGNGDVKAGLLNAQRVLAEARAAGTDVSLPTSGFLAHLDVEHQKELLPDVRIQPNGPTAREYDAWVKEGGPDRLKAQTADVDAETQASPEYVALKTELIKRFGAVDNPGIAESNATLMANAYANLARESGMKPAELLAHYDPKVVLGLPPWAGEGDPAGLEQGSLPDFGPKFTEFQGDAKGAVKKLLETRTGEAIGALTHPDIKEPIDLVWGKEGTPEKDYADGYGLAKIAAKHPEVMDDLQGILSEMKVKSQTENRAVLESTNHNAVIGLQWLDQPKTWLLTQYQKKGASGSASIGSAPLADGTGPSTGPDSNMGSSEGGDKILFQGNDREFGSKAWQEYYGLTRGAGRAAGDMEIRAKEAGRKALTKKGYGEFDQQREDEIRAQEDLFAAFDQSLGEVAQPRGWFRILPDGTFEIGRTKIGDLSTFVHEPAHSYLLMIQDLVKREGASENLKADHAKILDFLGAKDGEELTRDQNEQWARANEAYLREGKAPSPGMRGVFQRFSVWLGSIYRKASDLGVELDPEIRGVFDRLYAAEEGVNKAHEELAGPQLFKSAEEAGWTPEQFQAYADSKGVEVDQAKQEILAKLNEAALREKSSEWRADERATREAVTTLVDERPEYRAIRALRRGTMDDGTELTLNREELVQQFGEDRVKELQKKHLGLYRKEGGVDPETAAEVLGFDSGEEMMQAFEGADRRAAVIEDATRQAMTEKHGDIRYDGTIEDQARIAVNNEQHAANLMRELDALQKQVEKAQQAKQATKAGIKAALTLPKLDQFRSEAKGLIEAKPIMDIQPNRYALAQQKYSREAFKGMGKGDYEGARDAKLKEITNHFLFLEALKAQAEVDKTFDFVKRFGKAKTRERIAKAGGEQGQHVYLDQIDQLLERFQFTNTSNKAIQAGQAQALEAWANQQAANGEPVEIDPSVYTMGSRNYRELNLGELRAVKDALANIDTLAKNADGILVDGRRVGLEAIRGLFDSITPDKERVPVLRSGDKTTLGEDAGHLVRGLDAALQKVEWMADRFDRGDINGPFRTYIKKLIDDANGRKLDLGGDIHTRIKELADARDRKDVAREMDQTGIKFPSQTREMTRHQLISWAMNMGTAENRNVALFGEGLVDGEGSVSPLVDAALSKLTASDCRFIQGIWDTLDVLRPLIRDKQLRTAGVEPKWKENTPFTVRTADGETIHMKGGYFPLAGDPSTTDVGKNQSDPLAVNGAGSRSRPTVASGFTRDVNGATYHLWLEYPEVLSKHLNDVITNVTCGEAVAAVNKVISDPIISNAMAEKLGPEYVATLKPWLVDFVERAQDAPRPDALANFITRFRSGMVIAKLAGNIPSLIGQVSDVFKPIFAPGVSNLELVKAYADMTLHGSDLVAEIKRLSPNEMRHRDETFNREIRDVLTSKSLFDQKNHATAAFLMEGFRVMDSIVTFPTWLSVYRKGMNTHGIESQAVAEADRIVARTFQAGDPRNMSATFRNRNVWARLFTTFQNDGNTWYGIISSAVASKDIARVSAALMGAFIAQASFQALKNRGPGDKKDLKAWAIQQALLTPVGSLPYLGDAVSSGLNLNGFSGGGDVTSSAMGQSVAAFAKPFTHYDTMDAQDMVLSELDAAAPWVGVAGTAPALRGWKYVHHVQTGKVRSPSSAWEATRDFLTGPNPNEGGR